MAEERDESDDVRTLGDVRATSRGDTDDRKAQLLARLLRLDRECIEPDPVDADRYRDVNGAFVDAVLPHPSVVAIYGDSKTPTVPGISDADFTVVVDDDVQDVAGLVAAVDGVFDRFPEVCTHGAGILPKSVAGYYTLFDVFTLALDHLAGEPISPAVEENEVTNTLILYDNLASRPYQRLPQCILPKLSQPYLDAVPVSYVINFLNPLLSAKRGSPALSTDRLVLDKRGGLHLVNNPEHDVERFEGALGRVPEATDGTMDRVSEFRATYFDADPPDERYLELLVDVLEFKYEVIREFVAEQSIYRSDDRSFFLRGGKPVIATPAYRDLSIYDMMDLCLDSAITGAVVPPEVAHHLATLLRADDLFYGTPPDSEIRRPEVARLTDLRREVFEELIAFKYESGIADAMPETFCFPHVVGFVDANSSVGEGGMAGAATAVKHRFRDVRNRVVLRAWDRRLSRKTGDL